MLDNLKDLFQDQFKYPHTAAILQQVTNLLNIVGLQYMKDLDSKNAAIDAVCYILQSHKEAPPVVVAQPEQPQA